MPVITFEGTSLKKEQKKELVSAFTKAAAEITSTPPQFFTVVIREQPEENLGFAGETVEELKNGSRERPGRSGMNAIFTRRSVRKYQDRPVEAEKIDRLLRAAMQAPSAGNQQPWEFIVVQDRESLKKLSAMSPYAGLLAKAPLAFVLLGNEKRVKFHENWQQDLAAAAENLLLETAELGLGAVWLGVHPFEERIAHIRGQFALPPDFLPFAVIAAGYPADANANRFVDRYGADRVHFEKL